MERVTFEVHGRVQGVYFRKYTKETAERHNIHGWCRNTNRNTVEGEIEGKKEKVDEMLQWLCHKGSPKCQISRCVVKDRNEVETGVYDNFSVRK